MLRRIIGWILVCACGSQISRAQDFKLWNRTVQVHGFASQGFVYTNQNNWLTMDTTEGSGAMTDMGLNASMQVTDKFRIGAQVYDRNLGQLGQWHPSLDWAVADYRFTNWFGVRAGKVKTTLGLYNDSQDLDFLRVFALLPQGIYPTDLRETTIAHRGGDVYGTFSLRHKLGDLSYTAYVGQRSDSVYSGYPYSGQNFGVFLRSITGLQYGGDLRWNTPAKGLTIGISRLNQQADGKGVFINPINPSAGLLPYEATAKPYWTNQFYGEYLWHRLRLDAEYRRSFFFYPYVPGADLRADMRSWYAAGSYRIMKRLGVGSYYSHYTLRDVFSGPLGADFPSQIDPNLPQNHVYDKVIAAHMDLNRFIYVKLEGHFINGYGLGTFPNGFYPQQNLQGFKSDTNALVVKTGFHF